MRSTPPLPAHRRPLIAVYLACSAMIGFLFVFRVPPMAGFDEPYHWRRAQQIANGTPFAEDLGPNDWGGPLDARAMRFEYFFDEAVAKEAPISIAAAHALAAQLAQQEPAYAVQSFPSTASFSPVAYLPSAAGIAVARALHLDVLEQDHAGRLANLAAFLLLVWCVVTVLPTGGLAALALLTVPTQLHLATSFSADPLTNAIPALLIACCLRLCLDAACVPPRGWQAGLLLLALLMGLGKLVGVVLAGVVLLVPVDRFSTRRAAWMFRAGLIAVCVAAALGWNLRYPFVPGTYWHMGADPPAAIHALISAPWHAAAAIARNIWLLAWPLWLDGWGRFGGGPGPYHFTVPTPLGAAFAAALLALALADRGEAAAHPMAALLLVAIAMAYVVLLLLAFQIAFGPPASDIIMGVQGRYLAPPALLLVLAVVLAPPRWVRVPALAAPLALFCLLLDASAAAIALGQYAALWH